MISKVIAGFWVSAFCFFCVAGCASEGPEKPITKPEDAIEETESVVLLDKLKGKIAVENQSAVWESERLKVRINVRNRTDYRQVIEIQTVFKDAEGFSLGDETSWSMMFLGARETKTYTATSIDNRPKKFTVRIRKTR